MLSASLYLVYEHCIFPQDEAAGKCPTRDASPPLELAFRACFHSLGYISKTDISTHATHPKSYIANCLHLALFACTALIINSLRSVGNLVFCLHTACTTYTFCLHYLHLPAHRLHLSTFACTLFIIHVCTCLHDGAYHSHFSA